MELMDFPLKFLKMSILHIDEIEEAVENNNDDQAINPSDHQSKEISSQSSQIGIQYNCEIGHFELFKIFRQNIQVLLFGALFKHFY